MTERKYGERGRGGGDVRGIEEQRVNEGRWDEGEGEKKEGRWAEDLVREKG